MGLPGRQVRTVRRDRTARPLRPMFPQLVFSAGRTTAEKQNPASVSIKAPGGRSRQKDPEPFYVTCTLSGQDVYDENAATHDKSFAEILPPIRQGGHAVQF